MRGFAELAIFPWQIRRRVTDFGIAFRLLDFVGTSSQLGPFTVIHYFRPSDRRNTLLQIR